MAIFTMEQFVIGKVNNGYPACNEDTLMKITSVYPDGETYDIETVAIRGTTWKKVKNPTTFYRIEGEAFEAASTEILNMVFPPKKSKAKIAVNAKFGNGYKIVFREDDTCESNLNLQKKMEVEIIEERKGALKKFVEASVSKDFSFMTEILKDEYAAINSIFDKTAIVGGLNDLIAFFREFEFTPGARIIDTMIRKYSSEGAKECKDFIHNYFRLMMSSYSDGVAEKMKSTEFDHIMQQVSILENPNAINKRLKIYFGPAGCGKTTIAEQEADGVKIACNKSMLPADLLSDFDFVDGKPVFGDSALMKAITEGKTILFDEINNLPYDTLRFLQPLLDNSKQFVYKDKVVEVKEGFNVIGTMNLIVAGHEEGLPEPIVDRCSEIKEFKLSGDQLFNILTSNSTTVMDFSIPETEEESEEE